MRRWKSFRYKGVFLIMGAYFVIALILFAERSGIRYQERNILKNYLPEKEVVTSRKAAESLKPTCLVLTDKLGVRRVWRQKSSSGRFFGI